MLQENVKHFIPHHAITCAVQGSSPNEDVVSTILLIYNPATACPVHVHSYRCDSPETAQLLQEQLQVTDFTVGQMNKLFLGLGGSTGEPEEVP